MRRSYFFYLVLVMVLVLIPGVRLAIAQEPVEEAQSRGPVSVEGVTNSRISYQGILKEGGSPVTGSRDMTFNLYSDDSCATWVESIAKTGVVVSGGLFSTELDVTHYNFNGQGLWLAVEVGGTAIGCREILPAPYALSLRPGAIIADGNSSARFSSTSSDLYTTYYTGVHGSVNGLAGETTGVRGEGGDYGVYGTGSTGVRGEGSNYGVYGESDADYGYGVYGNASAGGSSLSYGLYGVSDSTSGRGVYGLASATSGTNYGVRGVSESTTSGRGVYGLAAAASGNSNGVLGESNSTTSGVAVAGKNYGDRHAGYFETGDFVSTYISNNSPSSAGYPALEVNNADGTGHLIKAWNSSSDLEFAVWGNGDVTADGTFTGGGADFAEMIAVTGEGTTYEPGDLLIISPAQTRTVAVSSTPYDSRVIGVYSTRPGFVGRPEPEYDADSPSTSRGMRGERYTPSSAIEPVEPKTQRDVEPVQQTIPVAIAGIVPVKVSAENGAIQPGDLLTTSSTPGHAMKADPLVIQGVAIYSTGTIIGKAFGSLDSGSGVIEMLVMLQ